MRDKTPVIFAWSGGKDSAYALHQLMLDERYEVRYLLSTFNGKNQRLSMHGVREELLEAQAERIGIPLKKVYVLEGNNREYERLMGEALLAVRREGVFMVAFGDIFLEDLRTYRENQMRAFQMNCLFPVWKMNTMMLIGNFITLGFKAITCCVNDGFLDESWCGRVINEQFVRELPSSADPCGENGEFHSFCFEGPVFKTPIAIRTGEKVYRALELNRKEKPDQDTTVYTKGFWFCDLLLT
ncbi:MAG: diphthine--ammonia ligase [Puia sp.]